MHSILKLFHPRKYRLILPFSVTFSLSICFSTALHAAPYIESESLDNVNSSIDGLDDVDLLQSSKQQAVGKTTVDFSLMSTAYSPTIAIQEFLNDWDAPLENGDIAYAQVRTAIDLNKTDSPISYGVGWRYDYLMTFTPETSQIYWHYKNDAAPNKNRRYPLALTASHNERIGTNIAYTYPINPSFSIKTRANLWKGLYAIEGDIKGQLTTQSSIVNPSDILDSVNNTDLSVDYYYDKPALNEERLNWHPEKPDGYGYSLDISITGTMGDQTTFNIDGYDVLGRMFWQTIPSTHYNLDYDVNGRPLYNLQGQLDSDDATQTLPWRVEAGITHRPSRYDKWHLGAYGQANDLEELYQLTAGYEFDNQLTPFMLTGLIEPQTKSFGMALDSKYGGVKLLTDDIDFADANRAELDIYGRLTW